MHTDQNVRDWFAYGAQRMREDEQRWSADEVMTQVGGLELAWIQQRAVSRGWRALSLYGGVVLADATGMGKTRVALALIWRWLRHHPGDVRVMLCVPARLRAMWTRALRTASQGRDWATRVTLITHHACSHQQLAAWPHADELPGLVVIDEAHRFRRTSTRRYDVLARLARHARGVVCLTASPVCHDVQDLAALLELFMARGWSTSRMGRLMGQDLGGKLDASTLALLAREVIIRRTQLCLDSGEVTRGLSRPRQRVERVTYTPGEHEQWVWHNLGEHCKRIERALYPGWGEGLFVELMWRRWESGAEALWRTLERLLMVHVRALAHHARTGVCPGVPALREVFQGAQEVLPFLIDEVVEQADQQIVDVAGVARDHARLRALHERVTLARDEAFTLSEGGRVHALCAYFLEENGRGKMLCFTSSVEAAQGCFEALRAKLGGGVAVGLVTGSTARVTGLGRCDAQDVLERFAPLGQECEGVYTAREQVDILVATDCIAEGVNLQDCACVVLLDLPYSPLGIAQRVGRFIRPGSPHEEVVVLWMRPAQWHDSLGMRRRLDHKALAASSAHVGGDVSWCEELFTDARPLPPAPRELPVTEAQDRLERAWRSALAPRYGMQINVIYQSDASGVEFPCETCVLLVRQGNEALGWRHAWWRMDARGEVCEVASAFVSELVGAMERGAHVGITERDDPVLTRHIERAVTHRAQHLQGLWWAPIQVQKGGVVARALTRLQQLPDSERVSLWLATHPLSPGTSRMLAERLDEPACGSRALLAWLEGERDASTRYAHMSHEELPRVEWITALYFV